ncbi:acyl carrier protein [Gloeobacter morelensis]|uniref:Acyl carrier protein n=1 Tax=Gloeobacter morelensis MG652769 TaxID=2781736 RepID=A0ABY3PH18_9CYAN|nr:acyl carrier protein [Gloeobacter morelensis]UFP92939.1 acyl carrier protein [Gloeobacter morelensis MG652769]
MSSQSSLKPIVGAALIQEWLKVKLSERLKISTEEIDPEETFSSHGLSSAQALILLAQLEEWLHLHLSPTLFWNYPTLVSFSHRIAEEASSPAQPKPDQGEPRWKR